MKTYAETYVKLLAGENILLRRANVETASFNLKTRELTIPNWANMEPDVEDLMLGHEVGHAIWTSEDKFVAFMKAHPELHDVLNVLEDVRIERLIKAKYPGIKKSFYTGYNHLWKSGFFGATSVDFLNDEGFIDRVNVHFKVGSALFVHFSNAEHDLVERIGETKTPEDVFSLALAIGDLAKKGEEIEVGNPNVSTSKSGENQKVSGKANGDKDVEKETDSDEPSSPASGAGLSKSDLVLTAKEWTEDYMKKYVEGGLVKSPQYYKINKDSVIPGFCIEYKRVLDALSDPELQRQMAYHPAKFAKFKSFCGPAVAHMVSQFTMKHAAAVLKSAEVYKSGKLDPKRLYAYKLSNDIFKQLKVFHDGKRHGMILLLDWSGSMNKCLKDSIKQVIVLSLFCRQMNIPFKVLAFSNARQTIDKLNPALMHRMASSIQNRRIKHELNNTINLDGCALIEFLTSDMTTSEFSLMCSYLLSRIGNVLNLGGTPLNEALALLFWVIPKFKLTTGIEKLSLITVTDGKADFPDISGRHAMSHIINPISGVATKINDNNFLSSTFVKMLKDHFQATTIGISLVENMSKIYDFVHPNQGRKYVDYYAEKVVSLPRSKLGFDNLFVILKGALAYEPARIYAPKGIESADRAALALSESVAKKAVGRRFLSIFVDTIA